MMRQSATSTVELNTEWRDKFTAEPFEVAWASEAIYFIRALESERVPGGINARVQISPDGTHWCDEGTLVPLPAAPGHHLCSSYSLWRLVASGRRASQRSVYEGNCPPRSKIVVRLCRFLPCSDSINSLA